VEVPLLLAVAVELTVYLLGGCRIEPYTYPLNMLIRS
jgi:hypothetical protein